MRDKWEIRNLKGLRVVKGHRSVSGIVGNASCPTGRRRCITRMAPVVGCSGRFAAPAWRRRWHAGRARVVGDWLLATVRGYATGPRGARGGSSLVAVLLQPFASCLKNGAFEERLKFGSQSISLDGKIEAAAFPQRGETIRRSRGSDQSASCFKSAVVAEH